MNPAQLSEWGRAQWNGSLGSYICAQLVIGLDARSEAWFTGTVQALGTRATLLPPGNLAIAMLEWRLMMLRQWAKEVCVYPIDTATARAYGADPYAKPEREPSGEYFKS